MKANELIEVINECKAISFSKENPEVRVDVTVNNNDKIIYCGYIKKNSDVGINANGDIVINVSINNAN